MKQFESKASNKETSEDRLSLDRLCRLNGEEETIAYISPKANRRFYVTVQQEISYRGILRRITWRVYAPSPRENDLLHVDQITTLICEAQYDGEPKYLTGIRIVDCVVNEGWRGCGFGSIVIEELIRYAERLDAQCVNGFLSWVDIGTPDDPQREEKRARLCRFYERHGFSVTPDDKIYRTVVKKHK